MHGTKNIKFITVTFTLALVHNKIMLFYCVKQKYINILSYIFKQMSVFYVHGVKAGDFIYTAFVSVN
jgi:hypothetical protein